MQKYPRNCIYIYYDSYEFNIFEAIKKKMLKCYSMMQSPSSFIDELLENLNIIQESTERTRYEIFRR